MKVAPIDRAMKAYSDSIRHLIVHTGQHYDYQMSDAFFHDLDMPAPSHFLGVGSGSHAEQTAKIIAEFEKVCLEVKPDLVIVVGDVNSTIACTLTAVKLGIKTAHVEGGLRSFDRTMPEEINRKATDAICDYCFITEKSAEFNLLNENFPKEHIFFTGNTMIDSLHYAMPKAIVANTPQKFRLKSNKYCLITLHRPSNVDSKPQLAMLLEKIALLAKSRTVVMPVHPRTKQRLEEFDLSRIFSGGKDLLLIKPLGYIDFLSLMLECDFVVTDSGGIQEETTVLGKPCITLRTTTERPVTVEMGTNELIMPDAARITEAFGRLLSGERKVGSIPPLWDGKASERISGIISRIL